MQIMKTLLFLFLISSLPVSAQLYGETPPVKVKKEKRQTNDYNSNNNNGNNNNNYQNQQQAPASAPPVDYSKYSDTELQNKLQEATGRTDLDAMLGLQKEIDSRKAVSAYANYSYVQLQGLLNKAVDKEDYKEAERIKTEMKKRDAAKGMTAPVAPPKGNDMESMSVEELTKMKNEALDKEDYTKAQQIQLIINKKKNK
jgi:hypothetical protein